MSFTSYPYSVVARFLRYIAIDTQSDPNSTTVPSTTKQKKLGKLLVKELKELGINDAVMDTKGFVYATLPSNTTKALPTIGFLAHIDTSPANDGAAISPLVHSNISSLKIPLPALKQTIRLDKELDADRLLQKTIISSDGSTLLGGDDKAGIAEIMDALQYLSSHPNIKRPPIRIAFTVDEEIGTGSQHFDIQRFGADFAYTVDGGLPGSGGIENFSAQKITLTFHGRATHPGYAKDKMVNSLKIASSFIELLPKDSLSPETTQGREGFIHPTSIQGSEEITQVELIIRDFDTPQLKEYVQRVKQAAKQACDKFPNSSYTIEIIEQYQNMKPFLNKTPQGVMYMKQALKNLQLTNRIQPTRGGTDGAHLTQEGLPCPNIFAGERNFHSKTEFVVIEDMELAVQNIVEIVRLWGKHKAT